MKVTYLIVGGGIAAGTAALKIRELKSDSSIMILANERHLPYHRPPLTKGLWTGKKKVEEIFLTAESNYTQHHIDVSLNTTVKAIDSVKKEVTTSSCETISFDKLLIATGGTPRKLSITGNELSEIYYYRYLDDYLSIQAQCEEGKRAVVIGGGFIGTEIAASLALKKISTTLIFPGRTICQRVFPSDLANAIMNKYKEYGIKIDTEDAPVAFIKKNGSTSILTKKGFTFEADIIVAGIGITPNTEIAQNAGIMVANGIVVNNFLQTSQPDIFAAGDVALFPYRAINRQMRVEHWDNAVHQGNYAAMNMVSQNEPYNYIPYFFSDLFEFGYEAVGDINSEMEIFSDWKDSFITGTLYYLSENTVRGVMLCNMWNKTDSARNLIGQKVTKADLKNAI